MKRRIENLEISIVLKEFFCVRGVAEIPFLLLIIGAKSKMKPNGNTQAIIQSNQHICVLEIRVSNIAYRHTRTHAHTHRSSVWCISVCVAAHVVVCKIYLVCKCELQRTRIVYYFEQNTCTYFVYLSSPLYIDVWKIYSKRNYANIPAEIALQY